MSHLRTAAISARLGMMRLSSGCTFTVATLRSRSSALSATGWVTKMRGRRIWRISDSHRTMPATPSTATCAPSGMRRVASSTPSTIGMPRSRASEARCEVEPPSSATTPATRGRMWLSAGPATRVTSTSPGATRVSSHSQFTTTARPEPQPMPAGWPLRPGCCSQISSGTCAGATCSGRACSSLKPVIVERPFDLDRHAEHVFGLAHQAAERHRLPGVEARLAARARPAPPAAAVPTPCTQVSR